MITNKHLFYCLGLIMKLFLYTLFSIIVFSIHPVNSEAISIESKSSLKTVNPACKAMYNAVDKGEIDLVKNIVGKLKTQEDKLVCIKYSLQQRRATEEKEQFQAFRYLVELLITMKLPNQQDLLNKILRDYTIVYLSKSPVFTKYLLSVGALPKNPDEFGEFPVVSALWVPNDWGDCETPHLLINASSPKILELQNKEGETALMQSMDKGIACPDEHRLLAGKTPNLNFSDKNGNTALHYLLFEINKGFFYGTVNREYSLAILRILLKRGASMKIPNKNNVTPSQLLQELQDKGCKCYIHE